MSKLIVISGGVGVNYPALRQGFKEAEVAFITAKEAMEDFGKVAQLLNDDDFHFKIRLRDFKENSEHQYFPPPPTKQKHPPLSFKNRGKGGKRKQW